MFLNNKINTMSTKFTNYTQTDFNPTYQSRTTIDNVIIQKMISLHKENNFDQINEILLKIKQNNNIKKLVINNFTSKIILLIIQAIINSNSKLESLIITNINPDISKEIISEIMKLIEKNNSLVDFGFYSLKTTNNEISYFNLAIILNKFICSLIKSECKLIKLAISCYTPNNIYVHELCKLISKSNCLKDFNFSMYNLNTLDDSNLFKFLITLKLTQSNINKNVTFINPNKNTIVKLAFSSLTKIDNGFIEYLNNLYNYGYHETLAMIFVELKKNRLLEEVDFSGIEENVFSRLIQSVIESQCKLKIITFTHTKNLVKNAISLNTSNQLNEISVKNILDINNICVDKLCELIEKSGQLKIFNFSLYFINSLYNDKFVKILSALKYNKTINLSAIPNLNDNGKTFIYNLMINKLKKIDWNDTRYLSNLCNNSTIDIKGIIFKELSNNDKLETLDLVDCDVKMIGDICDSLGKLKNIKKIIIPNMSINDKFAITRLCKLIKMNKDLEQFTLVTNEYQNNNYYVDKILNALMMHKNLKYIDITNQNIESPVFKKLLKILKKQKKLEELHLTNSSIPIDENEDFKKIILKMDNLKVLDLSNIDNIDNNDKIKKLCIFLKDVIMANKIRAIDFSYNKIDNSDYVKEIFDTLKYNNILEEFIFCCNYFGNKCLESLYDSLKYNNTLQMIDITGYDFNDESTSDIKESINIAFGDDKRLKGLELSTMNFDVILANFDMNMNPELVLGLDDINFDLDVDDIWSILNA